MTIQAGTLATDGYSGSISSINKVYIGLIALIAFIAPIPVGSNRPVFWLLWATIIGMMFAIYLMLVDHRRIKSALSGLWTMIFVALLIPIFGIIQTIPIGLNSLELGNLAQVITTTSISIAPSTSILAVIRLTSYILLFILTAIVINRSSSALNLFHLIFWGITIHSIFALLSVTLLKDLIIQSSETSSREAISGPFINRNSFASYLGMGFIIGIGLIYDIGNKPQIRTPHSRGVLAQRNFLRIAVAVCILFILIALFGTQSRAGIFSTALGACVAGFAMLRANYLQESRYKLILKSMQYFLLTLTTSAFVLLTFGQSVLERGVFTFVDSVNRYQIYELTVDLITQRPLWGFGIDTFELAFEANRHSGSFNTMIFTDAHNTYLENWVSQGIVFGSIIICLGVLYGTRLIKIEKGSPRPPATIATAWGILTLSAVHSLFDFSFEIMGNTLILLALLAASASNIKTREIKNDF